MLKKYKKILPKRIWTFPFLPSPSGLPYCMLRATPYPHSPRSQHVWTALALKMDLAFFYYLMIKTWSGHEASFHLLEKVLFSVCDTTLCQDAQCSQVDRPEFLHLTAQSSCAQESLHSCEWWPCIKLSHHTVWETCKHHASSCLVFRWFPHPFSWWRKGCQKIMTSTE